jgi:hypothetical protein
MTPAALAAALSPTRWIAFYDRSDPKVPPAENLLPFVKLVEAAGIEMRLLSQDEDTHAPKTVVLGHLPEIAAFLKGK